MNGIPCFLRVNLQRKYVRVYQFQKVDTINFKILYSSKQVKCMHRWGDVNKNRIM